jgi:hypothetical protein
VWVHPNDCTDCLSNCAVCAEVTLECLDPKIEYIIQSVPIPEGTDADVFLQVNFVITDSGGNELGKWNVEDGENVDWNTYFTIDSLTVTSDANQLVTEPESKLEFVWTQKTDADGFTYLDVAIKFQGMEEGEYSLAIITNGLKEWNHSDSTHYFFVSSPQSVSMNAYPKEDEQAIDDAGNLGDFIGKAGEVALPAAEVVGAIAAVGGAGLALPFIKFLQAVKMFNRLRYINTNFGRILTNFFDKMGKMVKDQSEEPDNLIEFSDGSRGKLTKFKVKILWTKTLWIKICVYLLSYIMKVVPPILIKQQQ